MRHALRSLAVAGALWAATVSAGAGPWLRPGDEGLRSDIQLLADAGVLNVPVNTWPISWPDIARQISAAGDVDGARLDDAASEALVRVRHATQRASRRGFAGMGYRISATHEPAKLRGFADTPREEAEARVGTAWLSDHFALEISATAVSNPDDDQHFRPDGSVVGVNIGNFMLSAGFMDRWWGPGWDGGLMLSTNARPVPTFTVERNYSDPFKSPLFRWIGPWRAVIAVGRLEGGDVAVPNVRFFAGRVDFKPRPWFEVGLSRTAQWCGGGRDCGWSTFGDMLLGRDNQVDPSNPDAQPGNQMAGYDVRLASPWRRLPLAFYSQWVGEDEAGSLPSKFLGQFGVEAWIATRLGGLRFHLEYADTACSFAREMPEFDCGYRNVAYPQGYTYRGRVLGHAIDNDSRLYSLGTLLNLRNGSVLAATFKRAQLNRDGSGEHAFGGASQRMFNVELRFTRKWSAGNLSLGAAFDDATGVGDSGSGAHGFISWMQGLE